MIEGNFKKRSLILCIACSILVHLVGLFVIGQTRVFEFTAPVAMMPSIAVDLVDANDGTRGEGRRKTIFRESAMMAAGNGGSANDSGGAAPQSSQTHPTPNTGVGIEPESGPGARAEVSGPVEAVVTESTPMVDTVPAAGQTPTTSAAAARGAAKVNIEPPLRKGSEFIAGTREKLTYRLVMFGLTVGEAVLEAVNSQSGLTITTRVTSNAVIAGVYPVDDLVETHLVCGNYLVTKIRQHEGSYTRNTGFTLMLRERKAFSLGRLRGGFITEPLPRDDVLDVISGFYYLRSQPIEAGKSLLLHLYDGDEYAPTVVEVLRNERIYVSGLGEVETLVVHPLLTIFGYFQRSGEMLVWLTADEYKVPVRMQTSIALGKVTAELVSAEAER